MGTQSVYVETSVWSFAFAGDAPNYRLDTLGFFDGCRAGYLEPFVSPIVLGELEPAEPPLRDRLMDLIRDVSPAEVLYDDELDPA